MYIEITNYVLKKTNAFVKNKDKALNLHYKNIKLLYACKEQLRAQNIPK